MTVRSLLIAGALTFIALLGLVFATSVLILGDGSGGARAVGLTNRQGMLSQKVAKEALAYARSPTPQVLARLRNTMQVFSVTHRALRFGGTAPLDLEAQSFEDVAGATDPELQQLLTEASEQWRTIGDAIEQLIAAAKTRNEALAQVELKNPRLLRKMKEVTRLLTKRDRPRAVRAAGEQGIVAERAVKEALLFDAAPDRARRDQLFASIAAFEQGHAALRNGRYGLPSSGDVVEKLDEANWLWIDQAEALSRLASEELGFHAAVRTINETNPELLATLATAAVRADFVAARNVRLLQNAQLSVLSVGLVLAVAAMIAAIRIGSSLRQLRDIADTISRGHVDGAVPRVGIGEIRDLSKSFERMRLSLYKAMELLERHSTTTTSSPPRARSTIDRV